MVLVLTSWIDPFSPWYIFEPNTGQVEPPNDTVWSITGQHHPVFPPIAKTVLLRFN